ncbi:MAG: GCN5-related N-acetyltransferase [Anaerosolibacter sp.]|jgi:GNAT superfamily N-acetyltransferase|uniref:GNAT family N-acetyltransferase n=1 Tax=Anaerosolibacter sp. TaxID=1872527 RepID=UPI0026144174|nr:GNAT family N-acetyltransferase [Anaerosolibacter sp.]MDF2545238.1 GCN5-related N-acetyltransferase [Anaerosolibacter sp.]
MDIKIKAVELSEIQPMLLENIMGFVSCFDSYLESHIVNAQHYRVMKDTEGIGYFSIFNKGLLTQFYLDKDYRQHGQEVFHKIRKSEEIQHAYVPTSDEFFLSHGLEYARKIDIQAYFFKDSKRDVKHIKIPNFVCKQATERDIEFIREKSGDFFDDVDRHIKNRELYIGEIEGKVAAFGIIEKSKLYDQVASIGMFTIAEGRQQGIGTNMIIALKELCYEEGITPIAGCWYYNHHSKKTLEKAGLFSQTRLLKIQL